MQKGSDSKHICLTMPSFSKSNPVTKCCFATCVIAVIVGIIIGIYAAAAGQVWLQEDEQALMVGALDKYTSNGPGIIRFDPFWYAAEVRKAILLTELQYVRVTDTLSGLITVVAGPKLFFPKAWDSVSEPEEVIKIEKNQYMKLVDGVSGAVRVLYGEQRAIPEPMETVLQEVTTAINVDEDTAALVLSTETGQQRLITPYAQKGLFFPGPYDVVLESRGRISCEPHEVVITVDVDGKYTHYGGNQSSSWLPPYSGSAGTSFFLQPHHELVTMEWTSNTGIGETTIITKIDTRSRYSFYEFTVRTSDNVELVLEGIIFWQIVNVETMVETTPDVVGDVWYHSRSALNQAVSASTLEYFMTHFNELVTSAAKYDDSFYSQRGVTLHSLEVTRYRCQDPEQEKVLQDIIAETTNRINELQRQQSINDVEAEKLAAELLLERKRTELVEAQVANARVQAIADQQVAIEVEQLKMNASITLEQSRSQLVSTEALNSKAEARAAGEAEGLRFSHSLQSYDKTLDEVIEPATRIDLYKFLSQQEATTAQLASTTSNLGSGSARLYLTPESLKLNLQQVDVSPSGLSQLLQPGSGEAATE